MKSILTVPLKAKKNTGHQGEHLPLNRELVKQYRDVLRLLGRKPHEIQGFKERMDYGEG